MLIGGVKFNFGETERQSFNFLKSKLCETPVLNIFDINEETELHTDGSQDEYGGILMQKGDDGFMHPVHYMSRKPHQLNVTI